MVRHHKMRLIADVQPPLTFTFFCEAIQFAHERRGLITTRSQSSTPASSQNARGDQMQNVFLGPRERCDQHWRRLGPHYHIRLLGEHVDDLSFTFVAPLGSRGISHKTKNPDKRVKYCLDLLLEDGATRRLSIKSLPATPADGYAAHAVTGRLPYAHATLPPRQRRAIMPHAPRSACLNWPQRSLPHARG